MKHFGVGSKRARDISNHHPPNVGGQPLPNAGHAPAEHGEPMFDFVQKLIGKKATAVADGEKQFRELARKLGRDGSLGTKDAAAMELLLDQLKIAPDELQRRAEILAEH